MDSIIRKFKPLIDIFEGAISQTENFTLPTLDEVEEADPEKWDLCTETLKLDKNNIIQSNNECTSKAELYTIAGYLMSTLLGSFIGRILDPFVGNGIGLQYFLQGMHSKCDENIQGIHGIETSDITDFPNRVAISGASFQLCNAASANVSNANILLLFDVPPHQGRELNFCNFADVKLVMRFISNKLKIIKKNKSLKFYVLLLGEIGAGCNTAGIFNWLNEHPHLARIYHRYIYKKSDSIFKGHREILLFRVVKSKFSEISAEYPLDNIKRVDLTDDPPYMVETSHLRNVASFYLAKHLNT